MATEPRAERVAVGGTTVHALVGGEGPTVLALHGDGGPAGWRRWHRALAEQFTVYAPCHPGNGLSDPADWMESPRGLVRPPFVGMVVVTGAARRW